MKKKGLTSLLLALLLIPFPIYAEGEEEAQPEEMTEPTPEPTPVPEEKGPKISATTAVLMDAVSGNVLYSRNPDQKMDPASLTKIMTVYTALEKLGDDTELTLSEGAFETYSHSSSVLWIEKGESMSSLSAAYASMLVSANDTTAMLAEGAGATLEGMLGIMNGKAVELSMTNTHFQNIFGIRNEENYSSAQDMALLVREAVKNDSFRRVFEAMNYTIPATNMDGNRPILQDCALIRDSNYRYNDARGCKIGSTQEGGYSLVATAMRGDSSLIAVVMGEENADYAYADTVTLFEYGFANFQTIVISESDIGSKVVEVYKGKHHIADVTFESGTDFRILLPMGIDSSLLTTAIEVNRPDSEDPEQITAEIQFLLDDAVVGTAVMKRKIEMKESVLNMSARDKFRYYFDLFSLIIAGLFAFGWIASHLHTGLRPPE